jgi:hypothetical protein
MPDVLQKFVLEKSGVRLRQDFGGTSPKPRQFVEYGRGEGGKAAALFASHDGQIPLRLQLTSTALVAFSMLTVVI